MEQTWKRLGMEHLSPTDSIRILAIYQKGNYEKARLIYKALRKKYMEGKL